MLVIIFETCSQRTQPCKETYSAGDETYSEGSHVRRNTTSFRLGSAKVRRPSFGGSRVGLGHQVEFEVGVGESAFERWSRRSTGRSFSSGRRFESSWGEQQ